MRNSEAALWSDWRRTRDEGAFRDLVVPELGRAVAVARGTGCDTAAAEDAVQEALVALARETTDEPLTLGVRTWLLRTVRDHARSSLRSARRRRDRERAAARPDARAPGTPASETIEVVEAALASLNADDREAVRLRYALDLDYGSVATILGTSEGAARVRVHRALERLRERFGEHATTLLGALPLPFVAHGDAFVGAAVAKAATAGAAASGAAAAAAIGGTAMATGKTIAAAGAVGLVLGAVATIGVSHVAGGASGEETGPTVAAAGAGDAATATESAPSSKRRTGSNAARNEGDPLEDLQPSDEERAWVRGALVAERERRVKAAIVPTDTGADVLRRYFEWGADVGPVLAGFDAARRHIRPDGTSAHRIEPVGDTTTPDMGSAKDAPVIEFGPGTFDLSKSRAWMDRRGAVQSLEVRGAGKERTTLLLPRGCRFDFGGEAGHVLFRDLTLLQPESNSDIVFDLRGTASVAFEGVRFSDWCTSAGHGSAIGTSGRAFLAFKDCEFLGPAEGHALSVRGPTLAVFDGCLFSDLDSVLAGWGAQIPHPSTVVLRDCRFEAAPVADSRILVQSTGAPDVRILVRNARVGIGGPKDQEPSRSATWGAKYAESIEGIVYAAATPRLTAPDALRALDFAETKDWRPVVRLTLADEPRDRPRRVVLDVATPSGVVQHVVEFRGDSLREGGPVRGQSPSSGVTATDASGLLPLRTLLAGCTGLDGEEVRGLSLEKYRTGTGEDRWGLRIETSTRARRPLLDASSGTPIDGR